MRWNPEILLVFFLLSCGCKSDAPERSTRDKAVPPDPATATSGAPGGPTSAPTAEEPTAPPEDVAAESGEVGVDAEPAFDKAAWLTPPADLAPPKGAERRRSGLQTVVLAAGQGGPSPRAEDAALAHYSIWSEDGKLIESSAKRGEPRLFRVGKQIAGWEEGLQLMTVGEKRRFWIPEKLAFKGRPGKPRGTLVWDAELLEVRAAPAAPPDVAKPPKDASKTASGLAWKELAPGKGDGHPKATSTVMVHYTGWTTNGKTFDSTVYEARPATFVLANVIEGWTEGIQLMERGQKTRFWIPQDLAYKGKKGKPKGTLVFDVELVDFSE